jgi:hypothetical protein
MNAEILENILFAIPPSLKDDFPDVLEDLLYEVKVDFTESEKQSAGKVN